MRISNLTIAGPASGDAASAGSAGAEWASAEPTPAFGDPNRVGSVRVPVRLYEPEANELGREPEPWGTLVWAHGGSFMRGTLDWPEADWVARNFAAKGLRVYSVDYVLASDTVKAPAPSNDVAAVLYDVRARHTGPVFVGGASAGGHLAALAALKQADVAASFGNPALRPNALVLVYPTLHRSQRPDAEISGLTARLPENLRFGPERIAEMYDFYLAEDPHAPVRAEVVGELPAERLAALPPTVIVNAESDDLRASAEQFAEQLREAHVVVRECRQPGTTHGYLNRPEESPASDFTAKTAIALISNELMLALVHSTGNFSMAQLQHLATQTGPSARSGLPLLPTPRPRRGSPVGYGRMFWVTSLTMILVLAALIALSLVPIADGMPLIEALDGYEAITGIVIGVGIAAGVLGGIWLISRWRVRAALRDDPNGHVLGLMTQSSETYDEIQSLGGVSPRYGQLAALTLSVSARGITVWADRGKIALRIARQDVLEVALEPRQPVMQGVRVPKEPYEAIVFLVRCPGGAMQLGAFVGDPRKLGAVPLRGERLRTELRAIERTLQLG